MSTEIVAELSVASFQRGDRPILEGIAVTLRRGEHWALVGPNGSGKTSLLRILAGYEWPSEGQVTVLGQVFGRTDLRELRKRIGLVSSAIDGKVAARDLGPRSALDVVLSGLDASFGLWRDFDDDERALALASLASLSAEALGSSLYEHLSQGERQRVLIARALVSRPSLLILDEACGGLDAVARATFLRDLALLAAQPDAPTIVFVTHHPEEIAPFITHALLLSEGRTVAQGPIDDVLTSAELTRAFGAPCSLTRDGGGFQLRVTLPPA